MHLVTLVTDWGTKDHFVGAVKAKLYSNVQNIQVIDISHNIPHFNIPVAAFVIKNACLHFPQKTIHILDIESVETKESSHVLVEYNGQYFICTDNGLPSLVFGKEYEKIIQLRINQDSNFYTFAGLDLFANVAIELCNGAKLEDLGIVREQLIHREFYRPIIQNNYLRTTIIYIDHYGNAYLNITDKEFDEYRQNRRFKFVIRRNEIIDKISPSYDDVPEAGMLLTVSSTGNLQLAINKSSIAQLDGLEIGGSVLVEFFE